MEKTERTKLVLVWLDDALVMENAPASMLQHRIKVAEGILAMEEIDRRHLSETIGPADRRRDGRGDYEA